MCFSVLFSVESTIFLTQTGGWAVTVANPIIVLYSSHSFSAQSGGPKEHWSMFLLYCTYPPSFSVVILCYIWGHVTFLILYTVVNIHCTSEKLVSGSYTHIPYFCVLEVTVHSVWQLFFCQHWLSCLVRTFKHSLSCQGDKSKICFWGNLCGYV